MRVCNDKNATRLKRISDDDECDCYQMRFLDGGTKQPSKYSILYVGVHDAIDAANFDEAMFLKRGGKYKWSKADMQLEW